MESFGFVRVASFAFLKSTLPEFETDSVEEPDMVDVAEEETAAFVARSEFLDVAGGRIPGGGGSFRSRSTPPRPSRGSEFAETASLSHWRAFVSRREGTEPAVLNFADGGAEDLRRLMQAIHRQYAGRHIETMVPKTADREARLLRILCEFSYTAWNDGQAAVFAYEMIL